MITTCTYKQHNTNYSYCTNCDNYIKHDADRFYNSKCNDKNKTKFNYCPNCGAKIFERVKKLDKGENK